jgi:hypothetical protein
MAVFDDDGTETKSIRLLETFCFQFEKNWFFSSESRSREKAIWIIALANASEALSKLGLARKLMEWRVWFSKGRKKYLDPSGRSRSLPLPPPRFLKKVFVAGHGEEVVGPRCRLSPQAASRAATRRWSRPPLSQPRRRFRSLLSRMRPWEDAAAVRGGRG